MRNRMKWLYLHLFSKLGFAGLLAALLACSGGAGPGGEGAGPMGALDSGSGSYAAGPMSLPAPSIINKGMIMCENVPGPSVQCRGSDGAVPANARVKLTVYGRYASAEPRWSDWLIPSAHAIPGNTSFCVANGGGAFGQAGECSVMASTGEKIGICVASGTTCISNEVVLTVPVEGGVVDGSTAIIKSLSTTPDGYIIFGRRSQPPVTRSAFRWTDLFFGTAHAQDASPAAPKLTFPAPVAASCPSNPNITIDVASASKAPEGQWLTIKSQKGALLREMFQLPGTQDDLAVINADNIGNPTYISVAMKNTVFIVHRDSLRPVATIVMPATVKAMQGNSQNLQVYLEVPKGEPGVYAIKADSFEASCVDSLESNSLTRPISFAWGTGEYVAISDVYRVPIYFHVTGGVGAAENIGVYLMMFSQEPAGPIPAFEGAIYRQTAPMRDFFILETTQEQVQMVALDPTGNRLIFVTRDLVAGTNLVTPVSLERVTGTPVAMELGTRFRQPPFLVVLDSGEQGAKAVMIPLTLPAEGSPQANLGAATSVDLGPIVADILELTQPGMWQWTTFDRVGGQVKSFVLGPQD